MYKSARLVLALRKAYLFISLGLLATASATAQPETTATQPEEHESGLPATMSGFADEGVFHLYKNESRLATMTFTWKKDGSFNGKSTLTMAGQSVDSSIRCEPDQDGRWLTISMETPLGPVEVQRDGSKATITHKDETETLMLKPGTMLFENFTPALMSQAVRAYDFEKGGKQEFPLFIVPAVVMEASLEFKDQVERTVEGRDMTFRRLTYGVPGVDVTVWADKAGRIYLGDVPSQHAAYVREGYESLRVTPETNPLLSKPTFEVTEKRGVMVAMRDGVELATDIYLPKDDGPFPVILVRTPYKKEMVELQAHFYARRGYAVAVQDCRGRFASKGTWEPFVNEPKDGYDTIEWLAKQPWSTGKVGMIGASYVGWVQWWAAREHPPHLVTIIPNVAPPDPLYNIPYEYGVLFTLGSIWWADILESEATADLSGAVISEIGEKKYHKLLMPLPVIELDKAVLGKENPYWRKWIKHPPHDPYWDQCAFLNHLGNVDIPVFHQSGWFDGDGIGSKLNYMKMVSHGHKHQKLVLGPWGHTSEPQRRVGDRDFGPNAIIDLQRQYLRWFDRWLKGVDNGIEKEPLVKIFVMGTNQWLTGDKYPLPDSYLVRWHLHSDGAANSSRGDGRLSRARPSRDSRPDHYTYDPGDPTPSPIYYEEPEEDRDKVRSVEEKKAERDAHHEKVTQERRDILVYTSRPLPEDLTFAGPMTAMLYASSSAKDTDWFVRLVEVDKEGKIFQLAEGKSRARYRNSMSKPELIEPGKIYKYRIDLWQTGITIPAGHRLRVEVASASYPLFSRNLNTAGHNEMDTDYVTAQQTIHHSADYPSHILLPIIPAEKLKCAESN